MNSLSEMIDKISKQVKNRYSCKDYEPKHNSRKELAETVRYIKKI